MTTFKNWTGNRCWGARGCVQARRDEGRWARGIGSVRADTRLAESESETARPAVARVIRTTSKSVSDWEPELKLISGSVSEADRTPRFEEVCNIELDMTSKRQSG
ncbi:hypothetical protein RSAG8_02138, partial [Rhizoctonia solani AG-8 WAC10335]